MKGLMTLFQLRKEASKGHFFHAGDLDFAFCAAGYGYIEALSCHRPALQFKSITVTKEGSYMHSILRFEQLSAEVLRISRKRNSIHAVSFADLAIVTRDRMARITPFCWDSLSQLCTYIASQSITL